MYQKEDLEKRRDELKRELEELTKNAQAQIDRLVGAIAILNDLIEKFDQESQE
jgi:hypothetical protein